ncbi:MAG: tripartite tricarboxylate transporter TctB family protein [Ideonella sp.]|nr:tripartite tricarboxylate transporter TctB family protein [Ideonella sp.]
MNDHPESTDEGPVVGARWPEVIVAGGLFALSLLVVTDSVRVGIGWADDGPRAGYFPFYIGLLLMASSGWILLRQLVRWRTDTAAFAHRPQLALVISVLVPIVVYVIGISLLGIYLASALLIGYFMRRYGKYGWAATAAVSIGVPLAFFLVFERWFLVLLPKGPIERLLGM